MPIFSFEGRNEQTGELTRGMREAASHAMLGQDLLSEGQKILVQVAKDPIGTKGARITNHISLPGRYVVYMPTLKHLGISRRIEK